MASFDVKPITSGQLRAARGFLGWAGRDLAAFARVSEATISRAERQDGVISGLTTANLVAIQRALEEQGITFLDPEGDDGPGVRLGNPRS